MARRSSSGTLIHCEYCGEDFSSTYKRCPFCGERPAGDGPAGDTRRQRVREEAPPEDDYVFEGGDVFDEPYDEEEEEEEEIVDRSRGGKRLSGADSPGPVNWTRTITFICSLVIIAAALVIVFAYLYPKIHTADKDTPPGESASANVPQSAAPSGSLPVESGEPAPSVESSPVTSDEPSQPPAEVVLGITLNKTGFTLKPDESYTIVATVDPASWSGEVTWSTTEPKLTALEDKGVVTEDGKTTYQCTVKNVNTGKDVLRATISVTAGDKTVETTVYCRPGSQPDTSSSGGGLVPGATGSITGASSGLRVRSGPGTSYEKVGSLRNGASVTIVSDAGDGWYEIKFDGGQGYIQGEYISVG